MRERRRQHCAETRSKRRKFLPRNFGFETLETRLPLAANVVINEFLASNSGGILDQDNNHSDWIELQNTGASAVDLSGWYLTNDAANPTKWQFPSTSLAPGGYLIVFASGKDRHISGQELHTNFTLDENGGYLALEMPDQSVAYAYTPYPSQLTDVSYGITANSVTTDFLVDEDAPVRVLAGPSAAVSATWINANFDDSSWVAGTAGVGYDTAPTDAATYLPFINTNIGSSMKQTTGTVGPGYVAYLRMPFSLANKDQLSSLSLQIRYDDAFVAYLNGVEIARSTNAPTTPIYTSVASASHVDSASIVYSTFDVASKLSSLVNGNNVLAIVGLNRASTTSDLTDFLIDPLLSASRTNPPIVGFMATPTPAAANNPGSLGIVADTKFSSGRGIYNSQVTVQITTATPGAQIRYTLDGTVPTATTGLVYNAQNPIVISTTTNLRAAAFKTGYTPTNVDTETYIFPNSVIQQSAATVPTGAANWGHVGPDWTMDPNIISTSSANVVAGLSSIPTMSLTLPWADMFGPNGQGIYISGSSVEKAVSTEYFTADGSQQFQANAGIEVQGGSSTDRWKDDKLSFRVKFQDIYGDTKLDFPLFTNPTFDTGAAHSFDTFILDGVLNNSWLEPQAIQNQRAMYPQDQVIADVQNLAGGYGPHGTYVNLYIDGVYWGMYYLHERPDSSFASSYLGGNKDDYDVIKHTPNTPVNNSTTAVPDYAVLTSAVAQNMTVAANYQAVTNLLDVKNLADYMIINYYGGNSDWATTSALHNWYASYDKVSGSGGKWRFHSWDAEHVFENLNDNILNRTPEAGGPWDIHVKLMANSEYKQLFADEIQRLMFNGGLLTPQSMYAIYAARLNQIKSAIYAESARWGDNQINLSPFHRYTYSDWFNFNGDPTLPYGSPQQVAGSQLGSYFPQRTAVVLNQFIAKGWFPSLSAPTASPFGGTVQGGSTVTLTGTAGTTIYYTLDGSDPRVAVTGAISNTASAYTGPITINAAEHVKARVLDSGGNWSPLIDAVFLLTTPYPVRIVEMNYHPADRVGFNGDDMEFVELLNTGTQAVDLNGVKISIGITYQFTSSVMLAPGQRIVVVPNTTVFQTIYGASANLAPGTYSGKLSNDGEEIRLLGPQGEVLQDFTYSDSGAWPGRADGKGSSLEIINPVGDPSDPANWRSSYEYGGTPGMAGLGPINRIVVNEVLTHSTLPAVDAIELYNTTNSSIDLSGWYLSDSSANYKKFRIHNGTAIGAGQYLVFTENDFNPATPSGGNVAFALSGSQGDDVWLLSANATATLLNFEDHASFIAAADGVSFGRWPNGSGKLYPMQSLTLGAANSGPAIGPVAISEVMYNPAGGNADLSFVELTNLTSQPVALSNTYSGVGSVGWKLSGMGYTFPVGTTIGPNASLVVVHFDPNSPADASKLTAFRAAYVIGAGVPLVGGGTGTLNSAGDTIQLLRPDAPPIDDPTFVPYVLVDEVAYQTTAPWPTSPNQQSGQSLTRWVSAVYGDEPTNWIGAAASPGAADLFPPQVTQVYVNGTAWSQAYRDYLASLGLGSSQFGYAIPNGPNQISNLTWGNINQISIQFNENVTPHQADLSLTGVNVGAYSFTGFSYSATTHTATWTISAPIPADQLQLHLTSNVADAVSHPLDGEWTDAVTTGASGNGLPGGDFLFGLNVSAVVPDVARGDLNFDGVADANDVAPFLSALTDLNAYRLARSLSTVDFTFIGDINGDHLVNNRDIQPLLDLLAGSGSGGGSGSSAAEANVANIAAAPNSTVTTAAAMPTLVLVTSAPKSPQIKPLPLANFALTSSTSKVKPTAAAHRSLSNFDASPPQPGKKLFSSIDYTLSEWSMYRSRHLHWQAAKSADPTEELFASWK